MDLPQKSPIGLKDEGRAARYRGDPITANPHPDVTPEHEAWRRAWEKPDEIVGDDGPDNGQDPIVKFG